MGCDYFIKNILEITLEKESINITLDEMKCYFQEVDSFELNSDCSDYESEEFYTNKYLSTKSYKNIEIYNNTRGWKNDALREKYKSILDSNYIDLKNVINIVKKQIRFFR